MWRGRRIWWRFLTIGHFQDIGVCLDVGHAHLGDGVASALSEVEDRYVRSSHLHDNKGDKDAHLWPGDGTIHWDGDPGGVEVGAADSGRGAGDSLRAGTSPPKPSLKRRRRPLRRWTRRRSSVERQLWQTKLQEL